MLLHSVVLVALALPPEAGECRGVQCASGECLPMGATCPSLRESGLVNEPAPLPQVADPFTDTEAERREARLQRMKEKRARDAARLLAEESFERAVFFNRLGFGLGAAASFSAALGAFAGAAALKVGHAQGCKAAMDIFADYGGTTCPTHIPGRGLTLTLGAGFAVAGLVFTIVAANSPARIARRMARLSFESGGIRVRF